ncbi:MAG: hypothetical protein COA58_11100 [Bacteroidetes bacterium]|nr:MAG: hypothetical protein COA58_11100 [Bacteroidota bacterium]
MHSFTFFNTTLLYCGASDDILGGLHGFLCQSFFVLVGITLIILYYRMGKRKQIATLLLAFAFSTLFYTLFSLPLYSYYFFSWLIYWKHLLLLSFVQFFIAIKHFIKAKASKLNNT